MEEFIPQTGRASQRPLVKRFPRPNPAPMATISAQRSALGSKTGSAQPAGVVPRLQARSARAQPFSAGFSSPCLPCGPVAAGVQRWVPEGPRWLSLSRSWWASPKRSTRARDRRVAAPGRSRPLRASIVAQAGKGHAYDYDLVSLCLVQLLQSRPPFGRC